MTTLCYYRELIIRLIPRQHKVEEYCLMYFRVLSHKTNDLNRRSLFRLPLPHPRSRIDER